MDRKGSKPSGEDEKSSGNEPRKKARHDSLGQVRRQRIMSHIPKPQPPPQESASSPAIKTTAPDQPQTRSTVELTSKDHDEDKKKKKLVKPEFPKPAPLNLPIDDLMKTFGVTKQKAKKSGDDDEDEGDKLRNVVIKSMKKHPEKFDPILQSTMQQTRKTSEDLKEKLRQAFKLPKKDPGVAVPFAAKEMDKRIKKKEETQKKPEKEEPLKKEDEVDDDFSDHHVFQDDTKYQNYPKDERMTRKRRPNTELHMAQKDAPQAEKEKRNSLELKSDSPKKTKMTAPKNRSTSLEPGDKTLALANKGSGLFTVKRPAIERSFDPNLGVASLAKAEPKPEARKTSTGHPPARLSIPATSGLPKEAAKPEGQGTEPAKDIKPRKASAETPKTTNANATSGLPAQTPILSEKERRKPQEAKPAVENDLKGKAEDQVRGTKGVSEPHPAEKSREPRKASGTEPALPVAAPGKVLPLTTAIVPPTAQVAQPQPPMSSPRKVSIPSSPPPASSPRKMSVPTSQPPASSPRQMSIPTSPPAASSPRKMSIPTSSPVSVPPADKPVTLSSTPGSITTPRQLPPPAPATDVMATPLSSSPVPVIIPGSPQQAAPYTQGPATTRLDSIAAPSSAPGRTSVTLGTAPMPASLETTTDVPPAGPGTVPLVSTKVPPAVPGTVPLASTKVPPALPGTVPLESTKVPPAGPGTVPPASTKVPPAVPGTVPLASTKVPPAVPGTVPLASTKVPPAVPGTVPLESTKVPPAGPGTVPPASTKVPPAAPTEVPLGPTSVPPGKLATAQLGTKTTTPEPPLAKVHSGTPSDTPALVITPSPPAALPGRARAMSTVGQPMTTPAATSKDAEEQILLPTRNTADPGVSQPDASTEPKKSLVPDSAPTPVAVTEPIRTDGSPRKMSIKPTAPLQVSPESKDESQPIASKLPGKSSAKPIPISPPLPLAAEPQAKETPKPGKATDSSKASDVKPAVVVLPPPTPSTIPPVATAAAQIKAKPVPAAMKDSGKPGPAAPTTTPGPLTTMPHPVGKKPPPAASVQQVQNTTPKSTPQGVAPKQAPTPGGPPVKVDPALDKHDIPTTHGKSPDHGTHKPKAAATIRDLRKRGQKDHPSPRAMSPRKTSQGYSDSSKPSIAVPPITVEEKKPDIPAPTEQKKPIAAAPPKTAAEQKKPIIMVTPPIEPVKPVSGPPPPASEPLKPAAGLPSPAAQPVKPTDVAPVDPKKTSPAPTPPQPVTPIAVPVPPPPTAEPVKAGVEGSTLSRKLSVIHKDSRKLSVVSQDPRKLSLANRPAESRKPSSAASTSPRGAKMSTAAALEKLPTTASRTRRSSSVTSRSSKQLNKPSPSSTRIASPPPPALKRQASVPNLKSTSPILKSGSPPAPTPSKQVQSATKAKPTFKLPIKGAGTDAAKKSEMTLAQQLLIKPKPKPKKPNSVRKLGEKNEEEIAKGFLNKLTQKVQAGGDLSHLQDFGIPEQRRLLNLILHSDFGDYEFGGYMRECYSPVLRGFCAMNLQERYRGAGRGEECFSGLDISKIGTKIQFKDRDRVKKLEDRDVYLSDLRDVAMDDKHFNFLKELANNQPVSIPLTIIHELSAEILPMIKEMWEYYAKNLGTSHECTMQAGRSFIQLLNRVIMYNNL